MADNSTKTPVEPTHRPEITGTATGTTHEPEPLTAPLADSTTLGSGDFAASDSAGEPATGFEKVASEVRHGAEKAREEIRRGAEATKHAASEAYDRASAVASDAYTRASASAKHGVEEARETLRHGYARLREDSAHWSQDLDTYVRANPGRSVMFAAAIGFAIGILLRGTDADTDEE
jgi:ElaB/YqjD/DUF883 family membrane-anchored ribosome-binding protein